MPTRLRRCCSLPARPDVPRARASRGATSSPARLLPRIGSARRSAGGGSPACRCSTSAGCPCWCAAWCSAGRSGCRRASRWRRSAMRSIAATSPVSPWCRRCCRDCSSIAPDGGAAWTAGAAARWRRGCAATPHSRARGRLPGVSHVRAHRSDVAGRDRCAARAGVRQQQRRCVRCAVPACVSRSTTEDATGGEAGEILVQGPP